MSEPGWSAVSVGRGDGSMLASALCRVRARVTGSPSPWSLMNSSNDLRSRGCSRASARQRSRSVGLPSARHAPAMEAIRCTVARPMWCLPRMALRNRMLKTAVAPGNLASQRRSRLSSRSSTSVVESGGRSPGLPSSGYVMDARAAAAMAAGTSAASISSLIPSAAPYRPIANAVSSNPVLAPWPSTSRSSATVS